MPRDIPVGNGSLLITFDSNYNIRDIYFPYVGRENHSLGHPFRFGVWVEGDFSWLGPDWDKVLRYQAETLVTDVSARNDGLGLELICHDAVDFHLNVYLKRVMVRNLGDRDREVRLFFSHDFHIYGKAIGDTAYYDPHSRSIIHYKNSRYFLANCCTPDRCGVDLFACGSKETSGTEGTWRDAEDGSLSGNPISQGSVDSTIGITLSVPAGGEETAYYWIAAGTSYEEVVKLNRLVWEKTPREIIKRTEDYWKLWVNKEEFNYGRLPSRVVELFKRSLLILRTQIDNRGAIIAANDSDIIQFNRDTYSYMWPRDGALVSYALVKAGYVHISRRFFDFCNRVITPEGYLMHKYNPDETIASSWHPWIRDGRPELPIQEDETALVIWVLWQHFDRFRDIEFIKPLYRNLIIRAAEFMVKFRDEDTKLPLPSYDLWEERYGVHSFTVAAVIAGLKAAAAFARAFGETGPADKYRRTADEIKAAMLKFLYHQDEKRFARMGTRSAGGYELDMTIDASLAGIFQFGAFPADDPAVAATMQAVKDRLWLRTEVGGMARYENDYYQQVSQDIQNVPGNPWFICTMWLGQYYIARANNIEELNQALPVMDWVVQRASDSGVLAEQVHPYTNQPLSVSPLTWSHATYVALVMEYMEKLETLDTCDACGSSVFRHYRCRRNNPTSASTPRRSLSVPGG
jgi:GH15 family glucan-1,4-alpha-glucosidase